MPRRGPPSVSDCMSRLPHELSRLDTVAEARAVMADSGVRHLPVLDGPRLYGVISERDVPERGVEGAIRLEDICVRDVFTLSPTDTVVAAARGMLRRNIRSAVVVDGGVVVGIFTTSDALAALIRLYDKPS